jgi:hypothetical protein
MPKDPRSRRDGHLLAYVVRRISGPQVVLPCRLQWEEIAGQLIVVDHESPNPFLPSTLVRHLRRVGDAGLHLRPQLLLPATCRRSKKDQSTLLMGVHDV